MDAAQAKSDLKIFLNDNLVDPWEQASNKTRDTFVFTNDIRMSGSFPKIQIIVSEDLPEKLSWGGKTERKERNLFSFDIRVFVKSEQKYTEDGITYEEGGSNDSQSLTLFYLERIRKKIITNSDQFPNLHNIRFGSKGSLGRAGNGNIYWRFMTMTCEANQEVTP